MLTTNTEILSRLDSAKYGLAAIAEIQRIQNHAITNSRLDGIAVPVLPTARLDAMSAGQLREHLTHYHPDLVRDEYPEYKYAAGIVPIDSREYIGVETIKRTRITRNGQWKRSSDANTNTAPVDIGMDDVDYGSDKFEAKITFTTDDLDRIEFGRTNNSIVHVIDVVLEKKRAIQESYQELINRVMAFGSLRSRVYGLHNHPMLTRVRAPYRMGLGVTPDQNIAIFAEMMRIVSRQSGQRSMINAMLIPDQLAIDLDQQQRNTASDTSTLKSLLTSVRGRDFAARFASTPEMDIAGPGSTTAIHGFRWDPARLQGVVPKRMRQVADPYYMNGVWSAEFECAISGVHLVRPYDHIMFYDVYNLS